MIESRTVAEMKYPIKVVANQTGLTPATLRAWEKRYRGVVPERDTGGRRLYSEALLQRLRCVADLVHAGYRVSDVVDLDPAALQRTHREFASIATNRPVEPTMEEDPIAAAVEAAVSFDQPRLKQIILDVFSSQGELAMIDGFVFPVLTRMEERIYAGTAKLIHRSVLESTLHTFLYDRLPPLDEATGMPIVAVGVPRGQEGTTGAVSSMLHAAAVGWYPILLGDEISGDDLAVAANAIGCKAILLSIVAHQHEEELVSELTNLVTATNGVPPILFGGRMSPTVIETLKDLGLHHLENMTALRRSLATIVE